MNKEEAKTKARKIAIIGDSTCDLTTEMRKNNDIDYARMSVTWVDKEKVSHEIYASLDWEEITPKQYFDLERAGIRIVTSQVTEQEFDAVFRRHLDKGEDIIYISCSSALSGSILLAKKLVAEKYNKEYPERKIVCVDSLCSCMGQGMMLLKAASLRDEGKTLEEIVEYTEKNKLCYNQVATVATLDYLRRAGRIKAAKSFFGNLFGVKPLFISDAIGNNYAVEKVKGRRNALLRIVSMSKERVINPEQQICFMGHADCNEEDIELLKTKLLEECHFKDVVVNTIGPIIGATTGPGTIGVYFVGLEETRVGK